MDAAAELGRNSVSKPRFSLSMEMSRLTRDGTAEPVLRGQVRRRERRQENIHFPCSVDHKHDWQPYPVDPYSCYMWNHTCMSISAILFSFMKLLTGRILANVFKAKRYNPAKLKNDYIDIETTVLSIVL